MKALFVFILSSLVAFQSVAQIDVYFATASASVDRVQKRRIDSFVQGIVIKPTDSIYIMGFADHRKGRGSNDTLSLRRAQAVASVLISAGVAKTSIVLCEGKGEVARDSAATEAVLRQDRRVTVMLTKPQPPGSAPVVRRTRADSFFTNPTNIRVNATYTLDIFFDHGSVQVMKRCMPELKSLYRFMKDNPNVSIRIEGHVCCPGNFNEASARVRQTGSEARARYVCNYLVENGIDSARLSYCGYGATKPIVSPEVTFDDMQRNRRVDVRITGR